MKKIKEIINHNWTITIIGGLIVAILGGIILNKLTPPTPPLPPFTTTQKDKTNSDSSKTNDVKKEDDSNTHSSITVSQTPVKQIKNENKPSNSTTNESFKEKIVEESHMVYGDEETSDEFTENDALKKARQEALNSLLSSYSDESQKNIVKRYKTIIIDTAIKTPRGTWVGKCKYSFDEKHLKSY